MSAEAVFLSKAVDEGERTARPAVNPGALANRGGREVVFVVKEGKLTEVPVETGAKIGDLVEIRRGPQPGEKVVLRPPEKLHGGSVVKSAVNEISGAAIVEIRHLSKSYRRGGQRCPGAPWCGLRL